MRSCSGRLAALELHYCSCMAGQADGMVEAVRCGLVWLKGDASPKGATTDSKAIACGACVYVCNELIVNTSTDELCIQSLRSF